MEVKLNEPQMGVPVLSLTYTGLETEFAVEKIEKVVLKPEFVIVIFAPRPGKIWRDCKDWFWRLWAKLIG